MSLRTLSRLPISLLRAESRVATTFRASFSADAVPDGRGPLSDRERALEVRHSLSSLWRAPIQRGFGRCVAGLGACLRRISKECNGSIGMWLCAVFQPEPILQQGGREVDACTCLACVSRDCRRFVVL
jgi:hypothetical protein